MSLPTPNYVTIEDIEYPKKGSSGIMFNGWDILRAGTFARPIDKSYVPKHVLEDERWNYFKEEVHYYCYTSAGFVVIRKDKLRPV